MRGSSLVHGVQPSNNYFEDVTKSLWGQARHTPKYWSPMAQEG
jgi:hypothetical protein